MASMLIQKQAVPFTKPRPDIRTGFTVRVHERIKEGGKERIQVFEGLVINVHKGGSVTDNTFTVRRIVSGIGVEKIFSLHSPQVEKIEVKKVAKVRRAKLFFLRGRRGKSARLSERFTTADEFSIATPEEEKKEEKVEDKKEEAKEEVKTEDPSSDTKTTEDKKEEVKEDKKKEAKPSSTKATEDKKDDK